jgi:hypothetical protein
LTGLGHQKSGQPNRKPSCIHATIAIEPEDGKSVANQRNCDADLKLFVFGCGGEALKGTFILDQQEQAQADSQSL